MGRKFAALTAAAALVGALALAAAPGASADSYGYVPPASAGCPPNVIVTLDGATTSGSGGGGWFGGGRSQPMAAGRVTVQNGATYSIPVASVQAMIFPDNSPVAPVYADCWGLDGQRVPMSPIPFQYGRGSCSFKAPLPTNGPSAGAYNWRQARAVVTLTNGAKCYSDMTDLASYGGGGGGGGGGGWPWWGQGGGGGGSWVIGSGNPISSGGGGGWGSPNAGSGSGLGSSRMVGGSSTATPTTLGGSSTATPTTLGGSSTTTTPKLLGGSSGGGGRKMLGLAADAGAVVV